MKDDPKLIAINGNEYEVVFAGGYLARYGERKDALLCARRYRGLAVYALEAGVRGVKIWSR